MGRGSYGMGGRRGGRLGQYAGALRCGQLEARLPAGPTGRTLLHVARRAAVPASLGDGAWVPPRGRGAVGVWGPRVRTCLASLFCTRYSALRWSSCRRMHLGLGG